MSTFIWVVLTFTVIEILCKLVLLATDSWRRPSKLTAILDIAVNITMSGWAIALLAKAAA
ncbi:hypothetical protein [Achromobacter insuavis]|uniref:hypothetical protein n=1 Tax=Achromobacter insuavis TaxID=1287735 RepID=UPI001F1480EA|nr:hypothetical protein [Achromobacter insuavis]